MAWPENINSISCFGFPKKFLPAVRSAIEHKMVEWGKASIFGGSCSVDFLWANCRWSLTENFEIIDSISLKEGVIDEECLTLTLLKGYNKDK